MCKLQMLLWILTNFLLQGIVSEVPFWEGVSEGFEKLKTAKVAIEMNSSIFYRNTLTSSKRVIVEIWKLQEPVVQTRFKNNLLDCTLTSSFPTHSSLLGGSSGGVYLIEVSGVGWRRGGGSTLVRTLTPTALAA